LKSWLGQISEEVATAHPHVKELGEAGGVDAKPTQATQIAFSASGLRACGLDDDAMQTFLYEFRAGMADPDRARILGDLGGSAPGHWHYGADPNEIHLVLMLYAHGKAALQDLYASHQQRFREAGLVEVARQETQARGDGTEPFGFRDGIAQPTIEGTAARPGGKEPEVKAGELILGYENAYGELPFSPHVASTCDPDNLLPPSATDSGRRDLGRNGSYLVIRKLEQDVAGFWKFVRGESRDPTTSQVDEGKAEWLAAKLMGRWPSGAPLALCPEADDPALGGDRSRNNNFDYSEDREGLGCPASAHVRRTNPRNAVPSAADGESLSLAARHRILRRGRPYQEGVGTERKEGIMFVAINANIGRQFEFVQQTWLNNPKFGDLYDSRDPIAGANHEPEAGLNPGDFTAVIAARPFRRRVSGIPRFVQTRGGGYFFLPGLKALRFLAANRRAQT
jgi:Dyp-type peroxidase family